MHYSNKSLMLSDKVEAILSDVVANLKLLMKELASGNTSHMDVEKQMLQLEAAKFELEAGRAHFKAEKLEFEATGGSRSSRPDPKLEFEKAALRAERLQLEAEKTQVRVESLAIKMRELEKKLDQWFNDKKAMSDQIVRSDKVFLDLVTEGWRAGRVVIKLDYDTTPRTAEKFRMLCTGEGGIDPFYKGKQLFGVAGGITTENDTNAEMYGSHFPLENLTKKHVPGAVTLIFFNGIVHDNQFAIITANCPSYDGLFVVFGHVVEGMDLVMEMELREVKGLVGGIVTECGQLF